MVQNDGGFAEFACGVAIEFFSAEEKRRMRFKTVGAVVSCLAALRSF